MATAVVLILAILRTTAATAAFSDGWLGRVDAESILMLRGDGAMMIDKYDSGSYAGAFRYRAMGC